MQVSIPKRPSYSKISSLIPFRPHINECNQLYMETVSHGIMEWIHDRMKRCQPLLQPGTGAMTALKLINYFQSNRRVDSIYFRLSSLMLRKIPMAYPHGTRSRNYLHKFTPFSDSGFRRRFLVVYICVWNETFWRRKVKVIFCSVLCIELDR